MRRIVAIAGAAMILTFGGCGLDEQAADVQPAGQNTESEQAKQVPVKLTAKKTDFRPSVLAEGDDYTSVRVTVINNTGKVLDVNPLYFAITDTGGTRHETADALGADDREIDSTSLQPKERARGTVTAEGTFSAAKVTFTEDGFGTKYVAEVG